jgi:hypothetical protein
MRPVTLAAVLAAAGLLAACSSETPAPSAPASASTSVAPPSGHGALAKCLSEHGVPAAPGPVAGPPPGVDQDTWQKAKAACSTLEPGPAG